MSHLINPYAFGGDSVRELARDTSFFTSTVDEATKTSDARNIGIASAAREVYAMLCWRQAGVARVLSSATVGGVSAIIHTQQSAGGAFARTAIISATVPTGTTAVVVATFGGTVNSFACAVISLDRLDSATPITAVSEKAGLGGSSEDINVDTDANGYAMAVGAASGNNTSASAVWTELTESVDSVVDSGGGNILACTMAYKTKTLAAIATVVEVAFTNAISASISGVTVR